MIQIYDLNAIQDQEIFLRRDEVRDVSAPVAGIIRTVREQGDRALYEYARRFDGAELSDLSVTGAELEAALEAMTEEEYAPAVIDAYLDALDRKAPTPDHPDAGTAYTWFQARVQRAAGQVSGGRSSRQRAVQWAQRGAKGQPGRRSPARGATPCKG